MAEAKWTNVETEKLEWRRQDLEQYAATLEDHSDAKTQVTKWIAEIEAELESRKVAS